MKFTDEQKELLALLPQELKNSKELTDSAKLVLSNIIFLYGMEDAQKNGYVYRTNFKMMEETGIKSEHTLIGAVRLLELLGYAETKRGKRNEASTYKLLINCSNDCSNNCSNDCSNKCSNKCSNNCSNNSENCSNEVKTLQNQVLLLQKQVVLLQKEIENLKNCSKKCSTDIDIDEDIDKDITTGTIDMKDLGPKVTEIEKENKKEKVNEMSDNGTSVMKNAVLNEMEREAKNNEMKTSTSDDQNKNEVKVNSPKVRPSSNKDNNTGGKVYIPKNYDVNSPTSHSEDDMTFEEYTEYDLKERGLTPSVGLTKNTTSSDSKTNNKVNSPKVRPSSNKTSNKATGDVQSSEMEQLPTNDIKTQPDAKEVAQTEREAKIASIMTNIELDKDGMLKAKNQMQFDASFADFKHNLSNLQHLVSDEAYQNFRSTQGKWWNATVKYLIWYKNPNKKPTKPTVEQMGNYQYHLDSMRIAQKIEDMENALNRMENWFEKMEQLYTKTVMQQYWQKFENDCASVKRSNPIFEEWQKKMSQMA